MDVYKKLLFDMQLCGMRIVTQKNYVYHARKFAQYCNKPIYETDLNDVREFLHYLRNQRKLNIGTVNYYHTCLKFLFQMTLEKPWNDWKVSRLRGYRALPAVLSREEVHKLLDAVAGTLTELTADPKHLGAQIGFTSILHTWGQNLMHHPHIHCVVPSGGLTPEGKFKTGGREFFIHVNVLSSKFKGKFLWMLNKAYEAGGLKFYGSTLEYGQDQCFQSLLSLSSLRMKDWVVYCKETFNGPEAVIEYLGRYTHRVCISNHRILDIENGHVTFKWKDYRDNKVKIMTIT